MYSYTATVDYLSMRIPFLLSPIKGEKNYFCFLEPETCTMHKQSPYKKKTIWFRTNILS